MFNIDENIRSMFEPYKFINVSTRTENNIKSYFNGEI